MRSVPTPAALVTATCLLGLLLAEPALAGGAGWATDYEKTLAKAAKAEKPLLVEFTSSDGSDACRDLERNVFKKSDFIRWSKANVLLVSLDFPEEKELNAKLAERNAAVRETFQVEELPTVVVVSAEGTELGRLGYAGEDAKDWMAKLEPIVQGATSAGEWLTDFEEAKKMARARRKPILADFTGSDWCGWCIKLKKEVFDTKEFQEWAKKNVVLLELDFPRGTELPEELKAQNDTLAKEYGIEGFPTILFLDAKGEEVGRTGYVEGGPGAWIEDAEKRLK